MPVKTHSCVFSEEKIYPGHGVEFVRRDGKKLQFVTCKTRHLFLGGRKPLNQRWTKSWRRAHKKESILRSVKKNKGRKTLKLCKSHIISYSLFIRICACFVIKNIMII